MGQKPTLLKIDKGNKEVLQPILTGTESQRVEFELNVGECIVIVTDKVGQQHEIKTTIRMWDTVYSKRAGCELKKKYHS